MKKLLLALSIILFLITGLMVFSDKFSPFLIILWLLSIITFCLTIKEKKIKLSKTQLTWKKLVFILVILLPLVVRILNLEEWRVHQDSFITAYFSAHYDLLKTNFFSIIPQDSNDWVSQFPTPFFFLQKIFFLVFNTSPLSIKLSVMPYILITSVTLFLTAKKLFKARVAIITLVLYSFFSPGLYMDTLGLHTASSDAAFSLFLYLLILNHFGEKKLLFAFTGIACAFCYLTYQSAYIAIPILILFLIFEFFTKNKSKMLLKYSIITAAFLFTISPFLIYSSKHGNYMFKRFHQVSFANYLKNNTSPILTLKNNALLSIRSMYTKDIGGIGGYNFGHLAFFQKISLLLFLGGFLLSLGLLRKKPYLFIIPAAIVLAFLGGIIITLMPPNFHRLAVAFPSIAIISSIPFYYLSKSKINSYAKIFIILFLLLIYSFNSFNYFLEMVKIDKINNPPDFEYVRLIDYIKQNYPRRKIYVAAYPSFVLQKIYYFFDKDAIIQTNYPNNFLMKFDAKNKYVYVILYPEIFNKAFENADSNGKINNNISTFLSVFTN
jgi:hypothetical protein